MTAVPVLLFPPLTLPFFVVVFVVKGGARVHWRHATIQARGRNLAGKFAFSVFGVSIFDSAAVRVPAGFTIPSTLQCSHRVAARLVLLFFLY